jgi:hypothetical protein
MATSKKISALPSLAGAQVGSDLLTLVDVSQPAATENVKSTLDLFFGNVPSSTIVNLSSGNALTVGPAGLTNPVLNVVTNIASQATGLAVTGRAAGAGVSLTITSSGANENLSIEPKGTGGAFVTSNGAAGLASGPNGNTNPVFRTVNNIASQATGLSVTGRAAAAGVDLTVLSSGTDESLNIVPKGTGGTTITATSSNALTVGPNGVTNPTLQVVTNVASSATGVSITGRAAGTAPTIAAISSGTNEGLAINGKGTGSITFQAGLTSISSLAKIQTRAGNGATVSTDSITVWGSYFANATPVGNVGGGEDDLMVKTVSANVFGEDLDTALIVVAGSWANNTNNKTVNITYGGTLLVAIAATGASAQNKTWRADITMIRLSATQMRVALVAWLCGQASATSDQYFPRESTVTVTHSNANIFKCTGQGTNDNDVTQTTFTFWKASAPS